MNESFKIKNTQNFLSALNEIYAENFDETEKDSLDCLSDFSLSNSPQKLENFFINNEFDNDLIDNSLRSIRKHESFNLSENLSSNKFESQSTNFMSENNDNTSLNFIIESLNDNLEKISAFNIDNKNIQSSENAKTNSKKFDLENLINQNLIITDEVVKIVIIGDEAVGKTLFLNKFSDKPYDAKIYEPTVRYYLF